MFSRLQVRKPEGDGSKGIELFKKYLEEAEVVIAGAGAGLSASAGFTYSGERFKQYFSDFEGQYGFHDMYTGGFFPYKTLEEYWAFWSRYIYINRYMDAPKPVYKVLYDLVKKKDYFIITTNVDHCFQKAGFDKKRLFYTQGDYGLFQCSEPCCQETIENETAVLKMVEQQRNMRIPSELIPVCPHCGKPLTMNLRSDDRFVEDEGWHMASERYENFLHTRAGMKTVYLELGVGYNTPGIIKYPFWQMASGNKNAVYVSVNRGEAYEPPGLEKRSVCLNDDIGEVLKQL